MSVELPVRGPDCPAALQLEALAAGDTRVATGHLAGCPACRAYVEALRAEQAAFRRARPRELFLGQLERRAAASAPRRSWWWAAAGGVALAASLATLLVLGPGPTDDGVALKGSPFRVLVRSGDGEPTTLQPDASLGAGDVLRFAYQAPRPGWLLVLDLDGTEQATVLYPPGAARSAPIAPGTPQPLPGAATLDDAPGPEWLVAVFSDAPLEAGPLQEQLRGQSRRAALALRCERCQVETLRFQRRPGTRR